MGRVRLNVAAFPKQTLRRRARRFQSCQFCAVGGKQKVEGKSGWDKVKEECEGRSPSRLTPETEKSTIPTIPSLCHDAAIRPGSSRIKSFTLKPQNP